MKRLFALLLAMPLFAFAQSSQDISAALAKLAWQRGPATGAIGSKAEIKLPSGYVFLDAANTSKFLELNGNPPRSSNYTVAPESLKWFVIFGFDEQGFVKDDEKLDPDDLLKSLKASDEPGNDERKKLGMSPLYTDGWQVAPHYDSQTKRLEWGVRLRSDNGAMAVNYSSRLLGRKGIMNAVLVSAPETLAADIVEYKQLLNGYDFVAGEKYSEFKEGDRVAEFGLAALILGGAAAVATKKGLWGVIGGFLAAFWKVLAGLAVAALVSLKSIFKKKKDNA